MANKNPAAAPVFIRLKYMGEYAASGSMPSYMFIGENVQITYCYILFMTKYVL